MSSQQNLTPGRRQARPRLESLSDLIYGLSLSIGAISLVITNGQSTGAADINRNILEFVSVFLILITSWTIYTTQMSVLPVETREITVLNVALLVLVAIIPYLFDQVVSTVNSSSVTDYASVLFTLDLAGSLVIMATFSHIIGIEEKQLVEDNAMIRFRIARNRMLTLATVVLLSLIIPWDWTIQLVHVRILFWWIPVLSFWTNRMRRYPFGRAIAQGTSKPKEQPDKANLSGGGHS